MLKNRKAACLILIGIVLAIASTSCESRISGLGKGPNNSSAVFGSFWGGPATDE